MDRLRIWAASLDQLAVASRHRLVAYELLRKMWQNLEPTCSGKRIKSSAAITVRVRCDLNQVNI